MNLLPDRRTVPAVVRPDGQIIRHLPMPAWVYDRDTLRFLYVNRAAVDAYGWSADEFLQLTLRDIRPPDEVRKLLLALDDHPIGRRLSGPYRHRRKDGSTFMVDIHSDDLIYNGTAARLVVAQDVTQRLDLERRMAESARNEALAEVAGGVAHDINNMLASIGAFAELLDGAPQRTAAEHDDLGHIREAVRRASHLARRFVQVARTREPNLVDLDLGRAIADLEPILRGLLPPRIALELTTVDVPTVTLDPMQFEQIVLNLVVNAREAMPGDGRIRVAVAPGDPDDRTRLAGDPAVVLSVADSGVGIPADIVPRIFEPFFTTKPSGTGFGLATTRRNVESAGGVVTVSTSVGHGTTFRVVWPASPAARVPV